jgi:hypothetical protein
MLLVETDGAFQLIDQDRRNPTIRHEGYTVVHRTDFVSYRVAIGQLGIVAELNDEATDEEWMKYYADSDFDLELARDSFLSTYGKKASAPRPVETSKLAGTPIKPVLKTSNT